MVTVFYEYMDTSGGRIRCDTEEQARAEAGRFAGQPVRVWIDIAMVQQGFIAADEREPP